MYKNILIGVCVVVMAVVSLSLVSKLNNTKDTFGEAVTRYMSIPTTASTTVFTLTTTSQRLLATSSSATYNRVAATIRLAGCSAAGIKVHLNINNDIVATTATGPTLNASTTEAIDFGVYSIPVSQNSVTGITNTGTCTVAVTEWLALR